MVTPSLPLRRWAPILTAGTRVSLKKYPENGPLLTPPPIPIIGEWAHMLLNHIHEELATLATLQKDNTCPPCRDVSGVALLRPSQIQHDVYEEWQGTLEIQ